MHPLHYAAARNDNSILLTILQADENKNINCFNFQGFTPVHYACRGGNLEQVQLLIEKGADIFLASSKGVSALHLASMSTSS